MSIQEIGFFERIEELVARRKTVANLFKNTIKNCSWMKPQKLPKQYTHSYWSFAVQYFGKEKFGISWKKFYEMFNKNGGDGFFGALSLQHNEIVMEKKPFYGTYIPSDIKIYNNKFIYKKGLCPIAEDIQPRIMVFKCGYRDMNKVEKVNNALLKTINQIDKS